MRACWGNDCLVLWPGPSVKKEQPNFLFIDERIMQYQLLVKAGQQHGKKTDKGAEVQGYVGERKQVGFLFHLSHPPSMCPLLKNTI